MTVLFADARGFTALVHELGPEKITPYIDEFFQRCAAIVIKYDGIIDHFRGDAVLAFFNVPLKHDDHVNRAIKAAKEVQMAVPEINRGRGDTEVLRVALASPPVGDLQQRWAPIPVPITPSWGMWLTLLAGFKASPSRAKYWSLTRSTTQSAMSTLELMEGPLT